ncbi:hypothetical protein Ndes2526A_g00902 [Nannochloris sp. 'desiccata']
MQQSGVRSSMADLKVQLDNLHELYNSTNEEVFSRLGFLSPSSKQRLPNPSYGAYQSSPLVTAAALMENKKEEDSAPRQFTRPRPTGNLFFYRPQNEAGTPLEQAQLASGPLYTPNSPSMVCSGGSGIQEEEEGWSCHNNKEERMTHRKTPLWEPQQQQQKSKETFNNAFPYPNFPPQNTSNRPAIKKDTAALDLILQKAAVFLSLSPTPQDQGKIEVEDSVVVAEGQKQMTPGGMPIVPRCLAFDEEEESILNSLEQEEGRKQGHDELCSGTALLIPAPPPPVVESIEPVVPRAAGPALHRLKQKTLERQSSQVAALSKLKQLTVQKQQHRIAMMRPQSALNYYSGSIYTTSTGCMSDTYAYNECSKTNSVSIEEMDLCLKTAIQLPPPPAPDAAHPKRGGTLHHPHAIATASPSSATNAIDNRPRTAAPATKNSLSTSKKPYLKRRSIAIPMQHQGVPDWSAVKPRTQSKLDPNLILRTKNIDSNGGGTSHGASLAARQGHQVAPRRYIDDRGVGIETMEQYTAKYNQHTNTHGVANRRPVAPSSVTSKCRNPWGSNRPSTAPQTSSATPSAGPLGQGKPLSAAAQRAAIRSTPFDPTSIGVNPAGTPAGSTAAFGPLGAAAIASGAGFNHQGQHYRHRAHSEFDQSHRSVSHDEIGDYEDPLLPLVSQVDQLLTSVGRAIRR